MRPIVAPLRWSQLNRVEHPPLMMKPLFQAVCGGLRWLEAKELAVHIATRAVEDGFPASRETREALGARKPPPHKRRRGALRGRSALLPATSHTDALTVTGGLALCSTVKQRRLVTYDVLDCTLGGGYHAGAVLENGAPYTRVVALDCDVDARETARELVDEFGADRFRFFVAKMSEAKSMFGERAFDAVMIDPGPSDTQLADPSRGFVLDDHSAAHGFDMRYGAQSASSALSYLNSAPQHTLAAALAAYGLLAPGQAMKMAREVRRRRPFGSAREALACAEHSGDELPEEGWHSQGSWRKTPMSWKFLTSLRCIVNDEMNELKRALEHAMLILRENGRLVVFTRLPWEERVVREGIEEHPHALLCYCETIPLSDVEAHGFTRHTKMWVATRVAQSSFLLKNTVGLTEEKVRESSVRWLSGMYAGQTHGFPANNFTFEGVEPKEREIMERNKRPPPLDHGLDDK